MRWEGREESANVEDRRGMAMPVAGLAGGSLMFIIFAFVISMLLGANPRQLLEQVGQQQQGCNPVESRSAWQVQRSAKNCRFHGA